MSKMTLPTDSAERKEYPLLSGCLKYFPAALAGVAKISKLGNDKHNPGQPLHHARGKSSDHGDCILRHLTDTEDLLAAAERNGSPLTPFGQEQILVEASQLAWRALAYAQELHEKFGAPLAPGAKSADIQDKPSQDKFYIEILKDYANGVPYKAGTRLLVVAEKMMDVLRVYETESGHRVLASQENYQWRKV